MQTYSEYLEKPEFDLTITKEELIAIAPRLLFHLKEFVNYGTCRQANTAERKMLAEHFAILAQSALKEFPDLKLNHCGAKTHIV